RGMLAPARSREAPRGAAPGRGPRRGRERGREGLGLPPAGARDPPRGRVSAASRRGQHSPVRRPRSRILVWGFRRASAPGGFSRAPAPPAPGGPAAAVPRAPRPATRRGPGRRRRGRRRAAPVAPPSGGCAPRRARARASRSRGARDSADRRGTRRRSRRPRGWGDGPRVAWSTGEKEVEDLLGRLEAVVGVLTEQPLGDVG